MAVSCQRSCVRRTVSSIWAAETLPNAPVAGPRSNLLYKSGPSYMKHGDGLLARYKNTATTVTKRIPQKKKLTKRRSENQNAKQNTCRYHSNKHCKNFEDKLFVISAPSPSPANHHCLALLKAPKRRKIEVQLVDRGVSQHNHTWRRSKWQPIDRGGVVCK